MVHHETQLPGGASRVAPYFFALGSPEGVFQNCVGVHSRARADPGVHAGVVPHRQTSEITGLARATLIHSDDWSAAPPIFAARFHAHRAFGSINHRRLVALARENGVPPILVASLLLELSEMKATAQVGTVNTPPFPLARWWPSGRAGHSHDLELVPRLVFAGCRCSVGSCRCGLAEPGA